MKIRAILSVLLVLILSLLAGCASSTSFQKASVEQSKSLIYVFRPESVFARGEMFKLEVNSTMQGMLINNAYLPVQVNPGQVFLEVFKNSLLYKPLLASLTITAKAGKTYYVKATPGLAWTVELLQLDEEQGEKEVSSAVFYKNN